MTTAELLQKVSDRLGEMHDIAPEGHGFRTDNRCLKCELVSLQNEIEEFIESCEDSEDTAEFVDATPTTWS